MCEDVIIYLRTTGGVVGVPLKWLNEKIRYFNRNPFLRECGSFWEWLSWEEGEDFRGICCLWNSDTSKVEYIKTKKEE